MAAKFDGMERSEEWWVRRACPDAEIARTELMDNILWYVRCHSTGNSDIKPTEAEAWHSAYLSPVVQSVVEREGEHYEN